MVIRPSRCPAGVRGGPRRQQWCRPKQGQNDRAPVLLPRRRRRWRETPEWKNKSPPPLFSGGKRRRSGVIARLSAAARARRLQRPDVPAEVRRRSALPHSKQAATPGQHGPDKPP
ncbi:unnamed protein product [Ixodes pacificus]